MDATERWRAIDHGREDLPQLLVRARFSREGYEVHLTDLTQVWVESLKKKDIIQRARRLRCSIDPGEDTEQFSIFSDKLQNAIYQDDGRSIEVSTGRADAKIVMDLSTPLPAPLPPLTWQLYLQLDTNGVIKHELVLPLLTRTQGLQYQLKQLVDEIRAKDHVITRLSDRLEASGTPLSEVFPNVANIPRSKTKSQREQMAKHIRGLATFDESSWRSRLEVDTTSKSVKPNEINDLLREVSIVSSGRSENEDQTDWWSVTREAHPKQHPVDCQADVDDRGEFSDEVSQRTRGPYVVSQNESIEDDFQRQPTPERLRPSDFEHKVAQPKDTSPDARPSGNAVLNAEAHDSSTDDEDIDEQPVQPEPRNPRPNAGVDKNEEMKSTTPSAEEGLEASSPAQSRPTRKLGAIGGRKAEAGPKIADPTPEVEHEPEQARPKAKSKLGMIGRRKPTIDLPERAERSQSSRSPPTQTKTKKLGTIGGSKPSSTRPYQPSATPERAEREETTPLKTDKAEKEAAPKISEETSEARADRKRNELKRELDQKAKVPTKKKRKF